MKKKTILLVFLIIFIFIKISIASPQFPHKPIYCFNNCHGELGYSYGDNGDDDCGNCHITYFNNPNFKEQHDVKSCLGCHKATDKDSYHILHVINYNISCVICHIDNTIPENTYSDCLSCHIGGLHESHENKECVICHINVVQQKITNTPEIIKNTTRYINETISINTSKLIINYKKITIYEILLNLYKQIRGDIYG